MEIKLQVPLGVFAHGAHEEGFIQIAMIAVKIDRDIDVHNISVFQSVIVGNPVTNHLIYYSFESILKHFKYCIRVHYVL